MGIKNTRKLPCKLEGVRRRIERWRRTRKARSPDPDSLWAAAVEMANVYGTNRTARALRLTLFLRLPSPPLLPSPVDAVPSCRPAGTPKSLSGLPKGHAQCVAWHSADVSIYCLSHEILLMLRVKFYVHTIKPA